MWQGYHLHDLAAGLLPWSPSALVSLNFGSLIICRLLPGVFGSPPLSVGAGTNTDLWEPKSPAVMSTLFVLCPYWERR